MLPGKNISAGLLSSQEIRSYKIIDNISDDRLKAASYDLTVGDKHFLYEESGKWKAVFLGGTEDLAKENKNIPPDSPLLLSQLPHSGSTLVIPAFGSAIVQLAETVDLFTAATHSSMLIAGRFDLKLKAIYKGLISQQATQVEPCYRGKLYCFLHNLGSNDVVLGKGETLATIEFSYVGQELEECVRKKIIGDTISQNKDKYVSSLFADEKGITDIRWLYERGMLPKASGIAPIYHLVQDNVGQAVDKHLETSDAVEKLAERVKSKMGQKQSALRIVFALITAVVTLFSGGFLIEVMAELRYFREELAFFANSTLTDRTSLNAIRAHTEALANQRQCLMLAAIIGIVLIAVLLLILCLVLTRPQRFQKWEQKRKALEAKHNYKQYKESEETSRIKRIKRG